MQETLLKALRLWPYSGVPNNPGGWLLQAARNRALDILRREANFRRKAPMLLRETEHEKARETALTLDDPLGAFLAEHRVGRHPKVHALLSLMLLQSSRLSTRVDSMGDLLLLDEQDRSLWDRETIHRGLDYLLRAMSGDALSEYHLQAGIAACHAVAPDYESTDWASILFYYERLMERNPSPIVALNRAVVIALLKGPQAGIAELETLAMTPSLAEYYLLPATLGALHERCRQWSMAAAYYREAECLAGNAAERRFLRKKRMRCEAVNDPDRPSSSPLMEKGDV